MAGTYPIGPGGHLDVPLSNLAVQAFNSPQDPGGLIADQVLPGLAVPKQSDKYYIIEPDQFQRIPNADRSPGAKAKRVEFTVSSDSYFAPNYALANETPIEYLSNADMAINFRNNSTDLVTGLLRLAQEKRVANLVTSLTNLGSGTTLSGGNKWSDPVNSDPIGDVTTGHAFIRSQTGLIANTAIIDWDTVQILKTHPKLLDYFKYTRGGTLGMEQLAMAFSVERILVPQAIQQNALETVDTLTPSITNIWGNTCTLAHIRPATGMKTQTFGLRFQWQPDNFPAAFGVIRSVTNGAGSEHVEIVEAMHFQDEKIVAKNLAYGIASTI